MVLRRRLLLLLRLLDVSCVSASPVHRAACICVNLHEQLGHLLGLEVHPQVGTQLGAELIDVQLP